MIKTLMAIAVAGAFALPVVALASAGSDTIVVAQAGANPPGTASPGTGSSANATRFDSLDKNRDGFISRDEAKDAMELNTRFSELDKNNDGKLSREEYDALDTGTRGATGATGTGSMSGAQGVPGKGPGGQEAASRPLGSGDGKTGATPK